LLIFLNPRLFNAPADGFPLEWFNGAWSLESWGYLVKKNVCDIFSRFDTEYACVTDRQHRPTYRR